MRIVLDIIRQSEVYHVCQIIHIESACSHIGSHQQLCQVVAEFLHRQVTLLLTQVTMQRFRIIAVLNKFVGYLLRLNFRTAEDDGEDAGVIVYDALQGEILVFGIHQIVDVVYVLGTLIARAHNNLLIVVQILLGDALHLSAHCGREHQCVVLLWQRLEDFVDAVREPHVQHLVSFVEYNVRDLAQVGYPTVLKVYQTAWRGDDDLHALFQ